MLLYDVAVAHCDDWFWFAVPPAAESEPSAAATGVVIKLGAVTVSDSFDEEWPLDPPDPATWALFHTAGRPPTDLVVWPVAPLLGPPTSHLRFDVLRESAVEATAMSDSTIDLLVIEGLNLPYTEGAEAGLGRSRIAGNQSQSSRGTATGTPAAVGERAVRMARARWHR